MTTNEGVKGKLRTRIQDIKNKIDDAYDREQEAKGLLKTAQDRAYELESDKNSKVSKIAMAQKRLVERNEQVRKMERRLRELEGKCERENELVKALEVMELDGDEKLSDLEKQAKNVNDVVESKELQNKELELRLAQLESELEKVIRREGDAVEKAEKLQEYIKKATGEMSDLKQREEGAYEREDESDKKLNFLRDEVHNKEKEAEEKERQVANLKRYVKELKAEQKGVKKMIVDKEAEMEQLNELTDDL